MLSGVGCLDLTSSQSYKNWKPGRKSNLEAMLPCRQVTVLQVLFLMLVNEGSSVVASVDRSGLCVTSCTRDNVVVIQRRRFLQSAAAQSGEPMSSVQPSRAPVLEPTISSPPTIQPSLIPSLRPSKNPVVSTSGMLPKIICPYVVTRSYSVSNSYCT
jgi:hypothetical protein